MTETPKNLGVLGGLAVNHPRLIEVAFPLKQASLDSVHEKNVRHGHISTQKIREAYGGRAPKVLDPFVGGGAIPLEAMRLGCEVTAIDINPVAWFILKCTLEYPQKLAGQYRPLPKFALELPEFMEGFFKGTGKLTKKQLERNLQAVQTKLFPPPDVDLAWHVRAWGWWVLQRAKVDLERFYPVWPVVCITAMQFLTLTSWISSMSGCAAHYEGYHQRLTRRSARHWLPSGTMCRMTAS